MRGFSPISTNQVRLMRGPTMGLPFGFDIPPMPDFSLPDFSPPAPLAPIGLPLPPGGGAPPALPAPPAAPPAAPMPVPVYPYPGRAPTYVYPTEPTQPQQPAPAAETVAVGTEPAIGTTEILIGSAALVAVVA